MQATSRLVLISPEIGADAFARDLGAALEGAQAAAVILRFGPADDRTLLARAKEFVRLVQATGAAALLQGADDIVGRSGADGAHILGSSRVADAVRRFRPEKMVGAGTLKARHDCMAAGEAGADYLLFGDGDGGGLDALLDRVSWWAEIFEVPCAALAPSFESIPGLVAAGADFIALGDLVWSAAEPKQAMRRAAAALEEVAA